MGNTQNMDSGQLIYILSRLFLSTLASFLAIMLWARTRDIAWMLMVIGVIAAFVETVYSIVNIFGLNSGILAISSMPLMSIILPCLPMVFFTAAFAVMVFRKYRRG
jgi:hypothetical protein